MTTFTVHEAKTHLSKLIAKVLAGEEVIIARGKEPAVKMVPVEPAKPKRKPGRLKGKISVPDSFFDPLPDDELALWNGEGG
ncbi:antitoxin [Pseudonocardia sp. TMWB2A]|uniref:type II toxin-antitoxin system Phd/YefM family antitoxin n=1 Tax=Pseudonocardia sp. TMWB2A TaxID=687430 RepID=UPI00307DE33B